MNIKVADFVITSDSNCFILNIEKEFGEKSKNAGEKYLDSLGYYVEFSHVLRAILKHSLLRSEARTLSDVLDTIETTNELINGALKRYETVEHSIEDQSRTVQLLNEISEKVDSLCKPH